MTVYEMLDRAERENDIIKTELADAKAKNTSLLKTIRIMLEASHGVLGEGEKLDASGSRELLEKSITENIKTKS